MKVPKGVATADRVAVQGVVFTGIMGAVGSDCWSDCILCSDLLTPCSPSYYA